MITSRSNAAVKRIRSLRLRKERDAAGLGFVEGIRLVAEAARHPGTVETVIVTPELLVSEFACDVARDLEQCGSTYLEVNADVFASLSIKDGPQGLAAVVRQRWATLEAIDPGIDRLWVALLGVQDPGNLGTILRTIDAVGGAGVILLGHSTDPYDPAAARASMGALFGMHLVRTSPEAFAAWKQHTPCLLVGTSDAAAVDYQSIRYEPPVVLLMGSEREGLTPELQQLCDVVAAIPMVGRSDSLNLAVATSVVLYEVFSQWRHND